MIRGLHFKQKCIYILGIKLMKLQEKYKSYKRDVYVYVQDYFVPELWSLHESIPSGFDSYAHMPRPQNNALKYLLQNWLETNSSQQQVRVTLLERLLHRCTAMKYRLDVCLITNKWFTSRHVYWFSYAQYIPRRIKKNGK